MKFTNSKKVAALLGAGAIAVAGSGVALAYFTSSGAGTGQATVGSAGTWGVAAGSATGSMYPGVASAKSTIPFTITNNGSGNQAISSGHLSAQVAADSNADITENGVSVTGCKAVDFVPVVGTPSPGYGTSIAPSGTVTVDVDVTMSDSNSNQDACQGASPDVELSITSG